VNSDQIRKQVEKAQKNVEQSRLLREDLRKQIDGQLNSPEFRKLLENAKAEAARVNTPEFRKQMEDLNKQLNSPEFRRLLENAKDQAVSVNTPEFRKRMEDLKKQLNSPEFRKEIEKAKSGAGSEQLRKQMEQLNMQFNSPEFKAKIKALAQKSALPPSQRAAGEAIAMNGGAVETGQAAGANDPLRVSGAVMAGQIVKQVHPVYPAEARAARIQGTVTLKAVIGKDGVVEQLSVVSGPPELVQSAMDAVRQWQYKPFLLNGNPVEVQTTINVNYTFGDAPPAPPATSEGTAPSTGVVLPKIIYKVDPQYPAEAKALKVKGVVVVGLTVTPDGLPANVHLVRSVDPGLNASALESVRQYRFKAATLNGTAVEKDVNVEVNFQLF
jgi:TonB family protein